MDVRLILVPSHAGDEHAGSSRGRERLLEAGARDILTRRGIAVEVQTIERGVPLSRHTAMSAADVNRQLAEAVSRATRANELPVVVAGSCNAALGVRAGLETHPAEWCGSTPLADEGRGRLQ